MKKTLKQTNKDPKTKEISLFKMIIKKSRSDLLLITKDLHKDQIITLEIQRAAWCISVQL